jgi:hypothetical protein
MAMIFLRSEKERRCDIGIIKINLGGKKLELEGKWLQ